MNRYCGKPECGLNRGRRCSDCEAIRVNKMALLLVEQGRLMAERRDRQDFFAAGLRMRRIQEIDDELDALRSAA